MKKISMAVAAATAMLLSSAAMAQQGLSHLYVEGGLGASHINIDCAGASTCDTSDTGAHAFLGYHFTPFMAGEIGYLSFGEGKAADSGVSLKLKPAGLAVGLAFRGAIAPEWDVIGRVGAISMKTKVDTTFGSDSETSTQAYAGVGVGYNLGQQLRLGLDALFSRSTYAGEEGNVRDFNVSLRYSF